MAYHESKPQKRIAYGLRMRVAAIKAARDSKKIAPESNTAGDALRIATTRALISLMPFSFLKYQKATAQRRQVYLTASSNMDNITITTSEYYTASCAKALGGVLYKKRIEPHLLI